MRTLMLVIFLFFHHVTVTAQWSGGAKTGLTIPSLKGNNEQSKGYTSRLGYYAGVFGSLALNEYLSLQAELNFSPQGGQRNGLQAVPASFIQGYNLPPGTNLYARFNNETIIHYLEIPALLQYTSKTKIGYRIVAGPYIAFRTSARTITHGSSQLFVDEAGTVPLEINNTPLPAFSFESNTGISNEIKTLNAGFQAGLAVLYKLGRGYIFGEGRFIRGLTAIQQHTETDGKNQTGSVIVAAGYIIQKK